MFRKALCLMFCLVSIGLLYGCGSTGSSTSGGDLSPRSYVGALDRGDLVAFTLSPADNSLTIINSTPGQEATINATYSAYTIPTLNAQCYMASNIRITNASVTDFQMTGLQVPFVELEGIALVAYTPDYDNPTKNNLSVYTYSTAPTLNGSLDGEYHYLDVLGGYTSSGNVQIGSYLLNGSDVSVALNTYADLNSIDYSTSTTASIEGQYFEVPISGQPTVSVALTPAGVMIIDKGPSNGMAIGTKKPDASYDLSAMAGDKFLVATSLEDCIGTVVIGNASDLTIQLVIQDSGEEILWENIPVIQEKPGLFSAILPTVNVKGGVAEQNLKFALLNDSVFFGIQYVSVPTESFHACNDNLIGVKVNE